MTLRSAAAAETGRRIVLAACSVYARDGFRNASIQAIARQANVSPATVLNHFETPDGLLARAIEHLTAELGLPEPAKVRAMRGLDERMSTVCRALATCFERGERWTQVYLRDRDLPAVQAGNAAFYRRVDALIRAALGPGRRDKHTVRVASILTGWMNFQGLRAAGLSTAAAADAVSDVLVAWLRSRPATRPTRASRSGTRRRAASEEKT